MHETVIENTCPWCQAQHDRASPVGGEWAPRPGDVSICIDCGQWCQFGPKLELRKPDAGTAQFLATDPECQRTKRAWKQTQKRRQ
jgi:hypothetical protein